MRWTTDRPTREGYYWVEAEWDIHQQGPFVLHVTPEDDAMWASPWVVCEPGGDYMRSLDQAVQEMHILRWSDGPIALPVEWQS